MAAAVVDADPSQNVLDVDVTLVIESHVSLHVVDPKVGVLSFGGQGARDLPGLEVRELERRGQGRRGRERSDCRE